MLLIPRNIIEILPIIRFEIHNRNECVFSVKTNMINDILTILKNHFKYQYKILTCISGVDYPEKLYRFQIVYEHLSIKYNSRLKIKIVTSELLPVDSVKKIFSGATWWECEIWDMFGIFFLYQSNLTRLLTDYGFDGYPLRKDFPLCGFLETRFNLTYNRVLYENVELSQEYRIFEYSSPWNTYLR